MRGDAGLGYVLNRASCVKECKRGYIAQNVKHKYPTTSTIVQKSIRNRNRVPAPRYALRVDNEIALPSIFREGTEHESVEV